MICFHQNVITKRDLTKTINNFNKYLTDYLSTMLNILMMNRYSYISITILTFDDLEIIGLVTKDVADVLAHTNDPLTLTVDPFA